VSQLDAAGKLKRRRCRQPRVLARQVQSLRNMCQHWGEEATLLRILTDNLYCCEGRKWIHLEDMNRLGLALLTWQVSEAPAGALPNEFPPAAGFFATGCLPSPRIGSGRPAQRRRRASIAQ
jgi:hypothetical protein